MFYSGLIDLQVDDIVSVANPALTRLLPFLILCNSVVSQYSLKNKVSAEVIILRLYDQLSVLQDIQLIENIGPLVNGFELLCEVSIYSAIGI